MERKTGVPRGLKRAFQTVLQCSSRGPDSRVELRFCVERVTGIEPAWPAWKVFRAPKASAELASILGIAVSMDAGRPRPAPEALTRFAMNRLSHARMGARLGRCGHVDSC